MNVSKSFVWYGIACCFFSLLSWFLYMHTVTHCDIDSKAYLERGYLWYSTHCFVTDANPQQPYYALGYPLIIGTLYKLCRPCTGMIILFQLFLSLLSFLLIMRMTRRWFGNRAVVVSALFCSLNLGYLVFTQFVLTEIVLSFLLLLFFERMAHFFDQSCSSMIVLMQSALALGASILIKPAALYFIFMVCFLLFVWSPGSRRRRLGLCLVFTVCFYIPVIVYMTYNRYAFNNFAIGTLDRVNLYYWFFPNVLAHLNHTTSDTERIQLLALSQGQHNFAAVEHLFWQTFRQHPCIFIRVWCMNVLKTFVGLYTTNLKVLVEPEVHGGSISFFKMSGNWVVKGWRYITAGATKQWVVAVGLLEALWTILRYILCLLGLIYLIRSKNWQVLMLVALFIFYFSGITGHDGCARFRMMFEFVLIVLAAGGVMRVLSHQQGHGASR